MTRKDYTPLIQSSMLALIGISLIAQPVVKFIGQHFTYIHVIQANPLGISPSLALTVIGMLILYLTVYLYKRRVLAYTLSIALTLSAFFIMALERHPPILMLSVMACFVTWMTFSSTFYTIKSDLVSLMFGIRAALLVSIAGYTYSLWGLLLLGPNIFHQHFSFYQATFISFQTLFTFHNVYVPTPQAELFIHSLDVIGGLTFVLIITSLFKPVRFALGTRHNDRLRAREILQHTSRSSEDYFKLWPHDKHYFFSQTRRSFLAYKTSGRTAIILGDPSGDPEEYQQLVMHFHMFVASNGWLVAAINATSLSESIYKQEGLKKLFIGNEAVITITDFVQHTVRSKHFRYVYNKAKRDRLTTEYWPSPNMEQLKVLKEISSTWLSRRGRKEYTFFMGYFDNAYLQAGSVMVLKQDMQVIAYISILPSFTDREASIDHLRSLPNASPVAMHFLLARLVEALDSASKQTLNIGLAPLSGIELQKSQPPMTQTLLEIMKKFGERYYSFKGIEQFKNKSDPVWYPRYLYYTGSVASLTIIAKDIERASRHFHEKTKRNKIIIGMIAFVTITIFIQFT